MDFSLDTNSTTGSNTTYYGWVNGPNGRGTLSILFSCISTLFICVWMAMHLNIPAEHEPSWRFYWRYAKWCFLGLTGPELVVWTAWRQFISARSLLKESHRASHWKVNQSNGKQPSIAWTMTHGFYAGMGGFVVDLSDLCDDNEEKSEFIPNHRRLVITPKGIDLLAQCGHLPQISQGEILDKSKTDTLAKSVAMVQGVWMLAQVMTRLSLKLPVTLLEVMTIAHVLCAALIYMMWWEKPRMIMHPTKLRGPWTRPLIAFMYMSSRVSAGKQRQYGIARDLKDMDRKAEIAFVDFVEDCTLEVDESPSVARRDKLKPDTATVQVNAVAQISGHLEIRPDLERPKDKVALESCEIEAFISNVADPCRDERHRFASLAITTYPALKSLFQPASANDDDYFGNALRSYPEMPERAIKVYKQSRRKGSSSDRATSNNSGNNRLRFYGEQYLTLSAHDWPNDDLFRRTEGLLMGCVLWFATIGYSAVHIAAWHAHFPTEAERNLWRISSLFIGGSGILWLLVHILAHFSATVWWYWYDLMTARGYKVTHVVLGVVCGICGVSYTMARLYLPVESFGSLRWLPAAAFDTPNWLLTFPHFN